MLAIVDLSNPLIWAILIGWIMSVVIHEFAHGLVAYLGGDYTIKERGGLSLNPLQYVDPVMSIVLPAVFLMMGGVPLPGGATYIRRDLLRSRTWDAAVSAAGPASNFILFFVLSLPFHPVIGWIDPSPDGPWPAAHLFLAAMAVLQLIAAILNLLPLPPLDGFQIIGAYLDPELRQRIMSYSLMSLVILFMILSQGGFMSFVERVAYRLWFLLGFGYEEVDFFRIAFNLALFGHK